MSNLTMQNLINTFEVAIECGAKFIGLKIAMDGFDKDEVIINPYENFKSKLAYYEKTYDEDLNHKYSKGIRITGFTFGEYFDDIQYDLIED